MYNKQSPISNALLNAIDDRNADKVRELLEDPISDAQTDYYFSFVILQTFLTRMNFVKDESLLKLFLDHPHCKLNVVDDHGQTLLEWLINKNNLNYNLAIKKLWEQSEIDLSIALNYAIIASNIDAIDILLNHPKIVIIHNDLIKLVDFAYKYSILNNKQDYMFKILNYISEKKLYQAGIFTNLLTKLHNTVSKTSFIDNVLQELLEIVDNQVSEAKDVATLSSFPLHEAVYKGDIDKIKSLLKDPSIDIYQKNNMGNTALIFVFYNDKNIEVNEKILDLFIKRGYDFNTNNKLNFTFLHYACLNLDYEKLAEKIPNIKQINLNAVNDKSLTPLYYTLLKRNTKMFDFLLKQSGIDLFIKFDENKTVIDVANKTVIDVAYVLLKKDPNSPYLCKLLDYIVKHNLYEEKIFDYILDDLGQLVTLSESQSKLKQRIDEIISPVIVPSTSLPNNKKTDINEKETQAQLAVRERQISEMKTRCIKLGCSAVFSAIGFYGLPFQYSNQLLLGTITLLDVWSMPNNHNKLVVLVMGTTSFAASYICGDIAYKTGFAISGVITSYLINNNFKYIKEIQSEINQSSIE